MSTNKPEMIILRGLQASGKSTWANGWVAQARAHRVRVNRDGLRLMIDDGVYEKGVTENRILAARDVLVRGLMERGLSVVVDDTNLAAYHVKKLAKMAHESSWDWSVRDFTDVPLEECIRRDRLRGRNMPPEGYVGEAAIRETWSRFLRGKSLPLPVPVFDEQGPVQEWEAGLMADHYIPNTSLRKTMIVDIDGTVALKGTRSPFDETRVHEDQPNPEVVAAVQEGMLLGYYVIFVSGRTNGCAVPTIQWLINNVMQGSNDFVIFMRDEGDRRPDNIVKREIFDNYIRHNYWVKRVYDDRNQVVRMWRSLGLTVFQVAEGNF